MLRSDFNYGHPVRNVGHISGIVFVKPGFTGICELNLFNLSAIWDSLGGCQQDLVRGAVHVITGLMSYSQVRSLQLYHG